jgi:hypothetical protein
MEHWLHGLPQCGAARLKPHALTSSQRLSLTFRMERPGAAACAPRCHCLPTGSRRAWLKARPDPAVRYRYECEPVGGVGRPCGFQAAAPWAEVLAEQLEREEQGEAWGEAGCSAECDAGHGDADAMQS